MYSTHTRNLTQTIGNCGRFQVFLTLSAQAALVLCVWGLMFMVFGMFNPGWRCLEKDHINGSFVLNASIRTSYLGETLELTHHGDRSNTTTLSLDCELKKTCRNLVYNQDSSTVVTEWDLSCDSSWVPSFIVSIQMTGSLLGSYLAGHIGDRFGRKVSLFGHVALHGVFHFLATFSVSWQMYTVVVFFIGVSVGGIITSCYPYPMEFLNDWWRGVLVSLPIWTIGFILFSFSVYILRDWRMIHVTGTVFSALVFLLVFWTPESVRWLTVRGKVDQAKKVVAKIARINRHPYPDTSIINDIAEEERSRRKGRTYTYIDLFRIREIRGLTIKFGLIWIILSYTYYVINFGIRSFSGDFYVNFMISSVLEYPGLLFVSPVVNYLGRRKAALLYTSTEVACCLSLVSISLLAHGNVKDTSILVLALLIKMINVGAWAIFAVYSAELFPTVVRNIHYGFLNGAAGIGSILSPYLFPEDPNKLYVAFIVLGILGIVKVGLVWPIPETKGRMLKDITSDKTVDERLRMNKEENEAV